MTDGQEGAGTKMADPELEHTQLQINQFPIKRRKDMAIQLIAYERRDNTDRMEFGNVALASCRARRKKNGISASRFFWYSADRIVIITEGEAEALDSPGDAELAKAMFGLSDLARVTMNWKLTDPQAGMETYAMAGRLV